MPEPIDPPPPTSSEGGVPRATDVMATGPARSRTQTIINEGTSAFWRFLSRWGLTLFVVVVVVVGRDVLLPFVFAGLIAYILAPIVRRMSERPDGRKRMPRGVAIILCYIVFLLGVTGFMFLLVPRLSRDIARLGKEARSRTSGSTKSGRRKVARWLEHRFPSLRVVNKHAPDEPPPAGDVPLPPGTAFTMTPLPDGRFAVQLSDTGVDLLPRAKGGFHVQVDEAPPAPATLEDSLRAFVAKSLEGLKDKLNDVLRLGQSLIAGIIRGIFEFFITLMIAAFMLIDMEKVHAFFRSLFPPNFRDDYDFIIAGIDRGLSGVIRGQLLICLINSVLTYIGLLVFGVKYGLILAVVAGVMSLIPIFGALMSSVPIVLVALVSGNEGIDIVRGLALTLWIIGIHFLEANLLNPKIIGTAARIHPVLVIFSLFLGEHAYGLVGALLAVPVLSAISVVFMYFYNNAWKPASTRGVASVGAVGAMTWRTPGGRIRRRGAHTDRAVERMGVGWYPRW